jgi:hypothetical protein
MTPELAATAEPASAPDGQDGTAAAPPAGAATALSHGEETDRLQGAINRVEHELDDAREEVDDLEDTAGDAKAALAMLLAELDGLFGIRYLPVPFRIQLEEACTQLVSRGPGDEAPAQGVARSSPQTHPHLVPPTAKVAAVLPLERSAAAVATRNGANAEAGSECSVAEYQTDLAAISSFEIGSPHIPNAGAARERRTIRLSRPALPPSRARSVGGPLVRSEIESRRCRWCRSWSPDRCCRPTFGP